MKKTFAPALLAMLFVGFTLLGIYDGAWLLFQGFSFVAQIKEEMLKPPKAPTWQPRSTEEGKHPRDIERGELALGVRNDGDYAPLMIIQDTGAVRAAGVHDGKWIPIQLDAQGHVICSPESFKALMSAFQLKPGEKIIIEGPPMKVKGLRVKP